MALSSGPEKQTGKLVVTNIGLLLSGALEAPILDADTLVIEGGRIAAIGTPAEIKRNPDPRERTVATKER